MIDENGTTYQYRQLIWAADQKTLYREMDTSGLPSDKIRTAIHDHWNAIKDKTGNDSILTVYLGVELDKSFFGEVASEHFFYTPSRKGQSAAGPWPETGDEAAVKAWLKDFFRLTTYEIAIPVLRDANLAPEGKTGLIVSILFDYGLTKAIYDAGWYDEFTRFAEEQITQVLDSSIYPGLAKAIVQRFSATPLTIERYSATPRVRSRAGPSPTNRCPPNIACPKFTAPPKRPSRMSGRPGSGPTAPQGCRSRS